MKVEQTKLVQIEPVTITFETAEELEWAYAAFSSAVHMHGVDEDSNQQKFYCKVNRALNNYASKYR